MPDRKFTLKDFYRMKQDVIDEYFEQHNANYNMQELTKANLLGNEENMPEGEEIPEGETI